MQRTSHALHGHQRRDGLLLLQITNDAMALSLATEVCRSGQYGSEYQSSPVKVNPTITLVRNY
jgi:hypothetical protein